MGRTELGGRVGHWRGYWRLFLRVGRHQGSTARRSEETRVKAREEPGEDVQDKGGRRDVLALSNQFNRCCSIHLSISVAHKDQPLCTVISS